MCWRENGDSTVFLGNFTCRRCEGNIGEAEEQEETLVTG